MIKQIFAQGDIVFLNKLFDTYIELKDDKEILKTGMKLIQKSERVNNNERLIFIFDSIYEIISKQRKIFHNLTEMEAYEIDNGNKKRVKYLKEYKSHLSDYIADLLKKLIKEIKKGITAVASHSKETEIFLTLNLADYSRYLCEVSLNPKDREECCKDAESVYQRYFSLVEESSIHCVNPSVLTASYHYAIFLYEILNKKDEAIAYLKGKHEMIIENLDVAYKLYVDAYPLFDLITDTLTNWIVEKQESEKENTAITNDETKSLIIKVNPK